MRGRQEYLLIVYLIIYLRFDEIFQFDLKLQKYQNTAVSKVTETAPGNVPFKVTTHCLKDVLNALDRQLVMLTPGLTTH